MLKRAPGGGGGSVDDESPIVPPPNNFTVETERKPVLYAADGTPLVKRPIGYDTRGKGC
jgi:hypothetical protein